MKKMYKIFGAAAIIGLFLISSIASTSLAAVGRISQAERQTISGQASIGMEVSDSLDGVLLPEDDDDELDDGEYDGEMYAVPEEWGFDEDEFLPFSVPSGYTLLLHPELVVTRIQIERLELGARFHIRVRNIGRVTLSSSTLKVRIPGKIIPQEHTITPKLRFQKQDFVIDGVLGAPIEWTFTGGLVIARPDCYDSINEWCDIDFTARYFASNVLYPGNVVSEESSSTIAMGTLA